MTEKQVVPKHVADWIKFCKNNGFRILEVMSPYGSAMRDYLEDFEGNISEALEWVRHNQDEFARAWLFGYTVRECPRYKVFIKGVKKEYNYLKHNTQFYNWYMGANMAGASFNLWHTKEELEEAGFGWVFFCDGVSVEEVKQ